MHSSPSRRRIGRGVAGVLFLVAVVLGVYAAGSYVLYDKLSRVTGACHPEDVANRPETFSADGVPDSVTQPYWMPHPVDVEFHSRDASIPDLGLRAWWIPGPVSDGPAVVVVHGWNTCRRDETVLMAAGMLHKAGFGVLLMDQRDHGDSGDEDLRFAAGTEEYLDVLGAWDWLVSQGVPEQRIGIAGMSFGAGTSLIAGGREPRVRAVWSDSSYGDIDQAVPGLIAHFNLPAALAILAPGAKIAGRLVAGDDIASTSPLAEMARYGGRPVAFVHGKADTFVAPAHAEDLRAAAIGAGADVREYWLVPGVEHVRADIDAAARYERRIVRFFTGTLGSP